ncbi:MAG: glycosyltransferase family 4 protein [bacterium]
MPAAAPPDQSPFSLAFVAHAVHRRGGMERAACEVLARVARRVPVTVIASACDMPEASLRFERVTAPQRPAVLRTWAFARAARTIETRVGATITNAIGAAAIDADVITAQFCHAAFTARFGGLRGGRGLRALYQRVSGARFVAEERHAYGSRRLKQVIAVSHGTARELQEMYGVAEERITVVPNGVDRTVFAPAADGEAKAALRKKLGLPADAFLALFVGGDWERKGVRDAIAAIAGVPDAHLVVLGRGDAAAFGAYAARVGSGRRVRFVPPSPSPEQFYAACDCFIFPSRYEAFSLVTLEAAASGLPIIAHAINGTEELVAADHNGWLVPFGPDALAEKVLRLRDDAAVRARMSVAATQSAARYDWDRIADEQFAVFTRAAAEARQAPRAMRTR